jgi:hypothetical protein
MSILKEYYPKAFNENRFVVERFNSASEVVSLSNRRNITDSNFENKRDPANLRKSWDGVNTWEEATELMQFGYQPFVEKLHKRLNFNGKGEGKRTVFVNDMVGFAPIVPLAIMGIPNNMVNSRVKPIRNKVVSVYYDKTAAAKHTPKEFEEAGVKLLSTLIDLEMQGYRFNLYVTQSYTDKTCDMLCVKVKDSNSPLDLKRMSFPIAHPAFFRVIGFDWYSRCPKAVHRWAYGHALGYEYSEEQINAGFDEIFNEKCVVFECSKLIGMSEQHIADVITSANKKLA